MCTIATQFSSCLKYKERGDLIESCLEDMFYWTICPSGVSTPNLTWIGLNHYRGYIFQDTLKNIWAPVQVFNSPLNEVSGSV